MIETKKFIRQSLAGVEYQFEYVPTPINLRKDTNGAHNVVTEYRVRRGAVGTWTRWFKTLDIGNMIRALGFSSAPSLVSDFEFEARLGRGEITLNRKMVARLANTVGLNAMRAHLYSRVKRVDEQTWVIPSSAVTDQDTYLELKKIISAVVYTQNQKERKDKA